MPGNDNNEDNYSSAPHLQAKFLSEALPYMQHYDRQKVVIKYGGHAMGDPELAKTFAKDIVLLKQSGVHPIVVHGGGPQIGAMLDKLGIKTQFINGLRVTDLNTINVVEMVLAGSINKQIVSSINGQGGQCVGISGKDGNLMNAKKVKKNEKDPETGKNTEIDYGFVGEPEFVNPHIVESLIENGLIPVIAPLGVGPNGQTYNINADTFAGALAGAMKAKRLLLLTDVEGVLDKDKNLIEKLEVSGARELINDGTISGGMIPKIESCISVVENGVEAVVILNGKVPHAVLLELFTAHGAGTLLGQSRQNIKSKNT